MKTVELHLKRLHRHYELAVRTYDSVAFLDLSHSLRIWVELKGELPKIKPAFGTTMAFRSGSSLSKVVKAARGHRHVFCYMPGGAITYAANGHLVSAPEMEHGAGDFSAGIAVKRFDDHLWLGKFCVVARAFDGTMISALQQETISRCNYARWLASEVVKVCFPGPDGELSTVTISREMFVKRVANTLDGSHPSLAITELVNAFDPAIHYLLQYKVGGLPLPYFVLLKIAQDILEVAPKLLGLQDVPPELVAR